MASLNDMDAAMFQDASNNIGKDMTDFVPFNESDFAGPQEIQGGRVGYFPTSEEMRIELPAYYNSHSKDAFHTAQHRQIDPRYNRDQAEYDRAHPITVMAAPPPIRANRRKPPSAADGMKGTLFDGIGAGQLGRVERLQKQRELARQAAEDQYIREQLNKEKDLIPKRPLISSRTYRNEADAAGDDYSGRMDTLDGASVSGDPKKALEDKRKKQVEYREQLARDKADREKFSPARPSTDALRQQNALSSTRTSVLRIGADSEAAENAKKETGTRRVQQDSYRNHLQHQIEEKRLQKERTELSERYEQQKVQDSNRTGKVSSLQLPNYSNNGPQGRTAPHPRVDSYGREIEQVFVPPSQRMSEEDVDRAMLAMARGDELPSIHQQHHEQQAQRPPEGHEVRSEYTNPFISAAEISEFNRKAAQKEKLYNAVEANLNVLPSARQTPRSGRREPSTYFEGEADYSYFEGMGAYQHTINNKSMQKEKQNTYRSMLSQDAEKEEIKGSRKSLHRLAKDKEELYSRSLPQYDELEGGNSTVSESLPITALVDQRDIDARRAAKERQQHYARQLQEDSMAKPIASPRKARFREKEREEYRRDRDSEYWETRDMNGPGGHLATGLDLRANVASSIEVKKNKQQEYRQMLEEELEKKKQYRESLEVQQKAERTRENASNVSYLQKPNGKEPVAASPFGSPTKPPVGNNGNGNGRSSPVKSAGGAEEYSEETLSEQEAREADEAYLQYLEQQVKMIALQKEEAQRAAIEEELNQRQQEAAEAQVRAYQEAMREEQQQQQQQQRRPYSPLVTNYKEDGSVQRATPKINRPSMVNQSGDLRYALHHDPLGNNPRR